MTVDILIFTDAGTMVFCRAAGAYRVATELRKHGYTVQVVDHFLLAGLNRIQEIIDKFVGPNTLFVGFSTTFMNVSDAYRAELSIDVDAFVLENPNDGLRDISVPSVWSDGIPISDNDLQAIRDRILLRSSNAKLVMGGPKSVSQRQKQIDTFIVGYADNTVIGYAKFLQGKNPFLQFKHIGDGRIVIDHDLDAAGFNFQNSVIHYEDSDHIRFGEVLPIEVARGCIFRCKFCGYQLNGKKKLDYIKDGETLYSELMRNYEKFGVTKYMFSDDTYNDSIEKITYNAEVFSRLPFKIEYATYLRHDLIWRYPEMADILKDSGLKSAIFGIETLNHSAGKIIGKGLSPELTRETLHWLREDKKWKGNVLMSSGFIIGLPTDSAETVAKWGAELISPDYPLDSFMIRPLGIKQEKPRVNMSEFELNYEKYGYYFDPAKSVSWINEHWRFEDAVECSNNLTKTAYKNGRNRVIGSPAMMLHNYGITWEQAYTEPAHVLYKGVFKKTIEMAHEYYSKLLA